nr:hypothetical protein [Tanacetum cinerariifolium]
NVANENVPAPAPIRFDDQILLFVAWLDEDWFILDANLLREALKITPIDQAHQFESPPSGNAIMDYVNELGYTEEHHFVSRMPVNNLYQPWGVILSKINQCLTGKTSGYDRPRYPDKKTKPHVIPYCWFTKLIIGREHNINQRYESLFNMAEDDHCLGNLKFVPKCKEDEVFGMPIVGKASTGPSTQPEDDTSANIVYDTLSPTNAETEGYGESFKQAVGTGELTVGMRDSTVNVSI